MWKSADGKAIVHQLICTVIYFLTTVMANQWNIFKRIACQMLSFYTETASSIAKFVTQTNLYIRDESCYIQ